MFACTFFGHRDCPASIRPKLRAALTELIEEQGVDRFYVGQQGNFDAVARGVLRELAETYPHIRYSVVLERLPGERRDGGISRTPSFRRSWRALRPAGPSPGGTSGCWSAPTLW